MHFSLERVLQSAHYRAEKEEKSSAFSRALATEHY